MGILIGEEWKWSLPFWLSLAMVHGVIAGFAIMIVLAVRTLEKGAETYAVLEVERARPELRRTGDFWSASA